MRASLVVLLFQSFPFDTDTAKQVQADHAKTSGLPAAVENSIGLKLALIPPGRFEMVHGYLDIRQQECQTVVDRLGIHRERPWPIAPICCRAPSIS